MNVVFKSASHVFGRREPLLPLHCQRSPQDCLQGLGYVGNRAHEAVTVQSLDCVQDLRRPFLGKQWTARQHFVEHDTRREYVASTVELQAENLLGGKVAKLSLQDAAGHLRILGNHLRDPKIQQLRLSLIRNEKILRAHVPVHDPERPETIACLSVSVIERRGESRHDQRRDRMGDGTVAMRTLPQDARQTLSFNELHGEKIGSFDLAEIKNLHDVGMRELRSDLSLVDEHPDELRVVAERRDDAFERYELLESVDTPSPGKVDLAHPSLADLFEKLVFPELPRENLGRGCARRARMTHEGFFALVT